MNRGFPLRVFLIDDHGMVVAGLRSLIAEADGMVVAGTATDGAAALRAMEPEPPDVAVVDLSMPGMGGYEVIAAIRDRGWKTRCVLLTSSNEVEEMERALARGADAFIVKDDAFEDLTTAIRTAARQGAFLSPTMAGRSLRPESREEPEELPAISPREIEVARLVARGLINKEIADTLGIALATVKTHRLRLMGKLGLRTSADLVRHALERGWA